MKDIPNFAIITIDSLRYDTTQKAKQPNFATLIKNFQKVGTNWHKVYAHGTYTLPAHISIFAGAKVPASPDDVFPFHPNDTLFKHSGNKRKGHLEISKDQPSISKYFESIGHRTIGIGGVGWFDIKTPAASILWKNYFSEFYYDRNFQPQIEHGFKNQIEFTENLLRNNTQKLFYFLNVGSTHYPFRVPGAITRNIQQQIDAYEYVDSQINKLIEILPKPINIFICADHGTCFPDIDGLRGHGFYHPKIMEVPACYLQIQ